MYLQDNREIRSNTVKICHFKVHLPRKRKQTHIILSEQYLSPSGSQVDNAVQNKANSGNSVSGSNQILRSEVNLKAVRRISMVNLATGSTAR